MYGKIFLENMYGLEKNLLKISIFQTSCFPFLIRFLHVFTGFAKDNPVWGPKRENAYKWFMFFFIYS